jgi:glyoxylase-like metal-dependent hydrolase (beta-lactamase superfamily II)
LKHIQPSVTGLTVIDVKLLSDGYFTLDKSFLVFGKYQGIKYKAALKPLLVRTDKELIILDTGVGNLPPKYRNYHDVIRTVEDDLLNSLKHVGVEPEKVTMVVNTHLHFDHCGNNRLFKNAKFLVQEEEIRYAYSPDYYMKVSYLRDFFDLEGDFVRLNGKYRIEEGVEIIPTPGHTIGHQSVVVRWRDRNIVYAGDAAPLSENIERGNIAGMLYHGGLATNSIDVLKKIENPIFIYGHDNEQLELGV